MSKSHKPCSALPAHWPLIALSGSDQQKRDELIAEILPTFHQRGIRVLVVKAGGEEVPAYRVKLIDLGNNGVLLLDNQYYRSINIGENGFGLQEAITPYISSYDIIILLAEEIVPTIETIQIMVAAEQTADDSQEAVKPCYIYPEGDDSSKLANFFISWLQEKVYTIPVWACVLIGGQSSRMGQPKHLLTGKDGRTWLEATVDKLEEVVEQVVLSGIGDVPESLNHLPRMVDLVDVKGPLTGILSAMRWNPQLSWLLVACDMPDIQRQGLKWLLSMRKPGVWGIVPRHEDTGYSEPLLAYYDFRSSRLFEKLLSRGCLRINQICKESKIAAPSIPPDLRNCWRNCNRPEDL